jgi:hypothetical protein
MNLSVCFEFTCKTSGAATFSYNSSSCYCLQHCSVNIEQMFSVVLKEKQATVYVAWSGVQGSAELPCHFLENYAFWLDVGSRYQIRGPMFSKRVRGFYEIHRTR